MDLLDDKTLSAKEKTSKILELLQTKEISPAALISAVSALKEAEVANAMEALEFFTKEKQHGSQEIFDFGVKHIEAKAPRLKWESAKVVGNTATISMRNIDKAVSRLLVNSEDPGTVVRWSAAYALGEILKLNPVELPHLNDTIERIIQREEKNSIKKIYAEALRKWNGTK